LNNVVLLWFVFPSKFLEKKGKVGDWNSICYGILFVLKMQLDLLYLDVITCIISDWISDFHELVSLDKSLKAIVTEKNISWLSTA